MWGVYIHCSSFLDRFCPMESSFSLRTFVRHLAEYALTLLRKSVLDSAEGASLLVAKLIALTLILLLMPVCLVLLAFLIASLLSDLLGVGLSIGVLLTLLLLLGKIVAIRIWYKPLTRSIRDRVKLFFIATAERCKAPQFADWSDDEELEASEDPFIAQEDEEE